MAGKLEKARKAKGGRASGKRVLSAATGKSRPVAATPSGATGPAGKPALRGVSARPAAKPVARKTAPPVKPVAQKVDAKGPKTTTDRSGKPARVSQKRAGAVVSNASSALPDKRAAKPARERNGVVVVNGSTPAGEAKAGRSLSPHLAENAMHMDVIKGIEARKAAAKAKSLARMGRQVETRTTTVRKLTKKQLKDYEGMLLRIRDELSRQIAFLRGASLIRSDEVNPEEDGSDAFERQLALKLASSEGDAIFEIDEALQRIREGMYGVCQDCDCIISEARLKALPFARRCVQCKAMAEKSRGVNDRRYF